MVLFIKPTIETILPDGKPSFVLWKIIEGISESRPDYGKAARLSKFTTKCSINQWKWVLMQVLFENCAMVIPPCTQTDRMNKWSSDILTDRLTDWLTDRRTAWLNNWPTKRLTDWANDRFKADRLTNRPNNWLAVFLKLTYINIYIRTPIRQSNSVNSLCSFNKDYWAKECIKQTSLYYLSLSGCF